MSERIYFVVTGMVFCIVATAHLSRVIFQWEVGVGGWVAPQWVSVPGIILSTVLAVWGLVLARRSVARPR